MKILVTGKNGFLAKNVIEYYLKNGNEVISISHNDSLEKIDNIDVVFHLAAVQRSNNDNDFIDGNVNCTKKILECCSKMRKKPKFIFSSSTGVESDTIFARTKKEAEKLIIEYGEKYNTKVYIFRLNHIFGKYGKPHFNNVISTFCYDIAKGKKLEISNPKNIITMTYIDDLMIDFDKCIYSDDFEVYQKCSKTENVTLEKLKEMLEKIKNNKELNTDLEFKLKETYQYFVKLDK